MMVHKMAKQLLKQPVIINDEQVSINIYHQGLTRSTHTEW